MIFSDLHKTLGISSVVFNLILGFTGAYWNLPALTDALAAKSEQAAEPPKFYLGTFSPETLLARAKAAIPDLDTRSTYINFPPRYENVTIRCAVPTHNPFRSDTSSTVSFDPQTGALKEVIDIRRTAPDAGRGHDEPPALRLLRRLAHQGSLVPGRSDPGRARHQRVHDLAVAPAESGGVCCRLHDDSQP